MQNILPLIVTALLQVSNRLQTGLSVSDRTELLKCVRLPNSRKDLSRLNVSYTLSLHRAEHLVACSSTSSREP